MTVRAHVFPAVKLPARFRASVPRIVGFVLRSTGKNARGEINVAFVDRKTIRRLNCRFLDTAGDTDVIAFPYERPSGDIYICVPAGLANARRFGEPADRELTRLVVHGTLHLLGYADSPKKARDKMWAKQEPLVEALWNGKR